MRKRDRYGSKRHHHRMKIKQFEYLNSLGGSLKHKLGRLYNYNEQIEGNIETATSNEDKLWTSNLKREHEEVSKEIARIKTILARRSSGTQSEKRSTSSNKDDVIKTKKFIGNSYLKKRREAKKGKSSSKKNLGIERVNWELLPVGTDWSSFEKHFNKKVKKSGNKLDPNKVEVARERFRRIYLLKPNKVYRGIESYSDYFALLFNGTDKVLLESVIYGNAAYVVSSNWRELSRRTKTELKDIYKPVGKVKDFRHTGDWFSKLKNYLQIGFE